MKYLNYVINSSSQFSLQKNGYGDLVVMSMETYDELLSTNHIDKAKAGFSDPKSAIYNA
jgi:hypothetical protein